MTPEIERRALQLTVVLACIVPLSAGGYGALVGVRLFGAALADPGADSHIRYLSGLLLGIGLAFLWMVPRIEREGVRFRLLAAIVVLGGLMRGLGFLIGPAPDPIDLFALAMEVGVTPLLVVWQARVAKNVQCSQKVAGAKVP